MPRGPRTPADVRVKVVEAFLELRENSRLAGGTEEPIAKEVREALRKKMEVARSPHALPSLRQVQAILTETRRKNLLPENKDSPWSLAISQSYGIPSDANGILLEMWAYCLTLNRNLTIRQAQWIDRLRYIPAAVENHDRLYTWASLYAGREKAALLAGQEPNNMDLDAFLALDKKSYNAGGITEAFPEVFRFIEDIHEVDPIAAAFALGRVPKIAVLVIEGHHQQHQHHSVTAPLHQLQQDITSLVSPKEVAIATAKSLWYVWRFWGRYFLRSPNIRAMSETEQEAVLQELAAEIVSWFQSVPPVYPNAPDVDYWTPSRELLNKAGSEDQEQP